MTRQQQLCNNKWFRMAVSVILTFAVLLVFVFSPFAEAHAVGAIGAELIDIIIAGLSACGITFTTTGGFGSLEDYVSNLIDEYAVDQNTTALGLLNGAQYGNNKLGQLLLNNRFVRFISAFATWIKVKFGLADNGTHTIQQSGTHFAGLIGYALPIAMYRTNSGRFYELMDFYSEQDTTGFYIKDGSSYYLAVISEQPATVSYSRITTDATTPTTGTEQLAKPSDYSYYYYITGSGFPASTTRLDGEYNSITVREFKSLLRDSDNVIEQNNIGIGIKTGVINPPLDDSEYDEGDGALVDVGGTWGATLKDILDKIRLNWQNIQDGSKDISMDYAPEKEVGEQLPEQTDIENLPGGTAWNPTDQQLKFFEFESIWHYVAQWISDYSAGAGVVWNAAMQLPSPVVNMVYAMVTLAIIFGVIKVMRA